MKILHIITRLILGGAQQNTVLSCAGQVKAGHDVTLAFGPIYGPEGSMLADAQAAGCQLIELRWMRRAILPFNDILCYRRIRRLIRTLKPDIVHTHSSKAGILGRLAAWREKHPAIVHTIHGSPFHDQQPAAIRRAYIAAERYAARRCHQLISVSQGNVDDYLAAGIGEPGQYVVVPSGVDVHAFRFDANLRQQVRGQYGIAPDTPLVGIVARLDPLKGQADLVQILPAILDQYPQAKLMFVGDGWHRQALEKRVRQAALEDHVIFTGLVPPDRVPGLLCAMDVHALPSYQEGQPRALVQALLCGRPIVGYDAGGIGRVCIDGQTGRLVPVGDRAALAQAIKWSLAHRDESQALARQGRLFAESQFSVDRMIAMLEDIYQNLLAAGPSKS